MDGNIRGEKVFANTKRVGTLVQRVASRLERGWVMKGSFVAGEALIPTAFTAAGFKEAEGGLSVITGRR